MSIAAELRAGIIAMLADAGRPLTLRKKIAGTYDVTSGSTTGDTTADHTGRGRMGNYSDFMKANSEVREGDRRCTFLPDDLTVIPEAGDLILIITDDGSSSPSLDFSDPNNSQYVPNV